jgi:hypothetical protein
MFINSGDKDFNKSENRSEKFILNEQGESQEISSSINIMKNHRIYVKLPLHQSLIV